VLRAKSIRVNVIAPAVVKTPMAKRATENEGIFRFISAAA
jgi:NAD(P)-dependent dehydrogenase (short-subunit alcohol dehydrogenase family)